MIEHSGSGCFEGFVGVIKIEREDAGGKLAAPEADWAILGINEMSSGDLTALSDNDVVLMKSK